MKNIIFAVGQCEWESSFVSALGHPMHGINIARRCVDAIDVRAVVQRTEVDAVIISDDTMRLSDDFYIELTERNIRIIALTTQVGLWAQQSNVDVLALDIHEPLASVATLVRSIHAQFVPQSSQETETGHLVAVAGFGSSAGRSATIRELGWQLTDDARTVLIVDGDTYGASLHQEFGLGTSTHGMLDLCRAWESHLLTSETFCDYVTQLSDALHMVTGLARSSRWTQLRLPALRGVWQQAVATYDAVLVDIGPVIEVDKPSGYEDSLPRRNSVPLTVLQNAATTFLCTKSDDVNLTRLIRGFNEHHELFAVTNVHVIVWGSDNHTDEVTQAIVRHTGLTSISHIPSDGERIAKVFGQSQSISALWPKCDYASAFAEVKTRAFDSIIADEAVEKNRLLKIRKSAAA